MRRPRTRVIEAEARVVQRVYEMYTVDGLSIGEITRRLNAEGIPTRKRSARWERSTVWAMLRNSAYRGARLLRQDARRRLERALPSAASARCDICPATQHGHERPREEWIEIPVPALVSEESFARAQELLQENKVRSQRRTITPSMVQGWSAARSVAMPSRAPRRRSSARKIHYYKCIGSDSWRKLGGPVCDNAPLGAAGSARSNRLERGDPIARRPDADPAGTRSPLGCGTLVRSD